MLKRELSKDMDKFVEEVLRDVKIQQREEALSKREEAFARKQEQIKTEKEDPQFCFNFTGVRAKEDNQ